MEQGKKCVDERHGIIIDKQRLALAEFRAQLKAKSPPLGGLLNLTSELLICVKILQVSFFISVCFH